LLEIKPQSRLGAAPHSKTLLPEWRNGVVDPVPIRIDENEIRVREDDRKDCSRDQRRNQATFASLPEDYEIQRRDGEKDIASVDHIGNYDEKEKYRRKPQHEKRFAMILSCFYEAHRSRCKCGNNHQPRRCQPDVPHAIAERVPGNK